MTLLRKTILTLIAAAAMLQSLVAQNTTVTYRFDIAAEGIYLVETVEREVAGSARKQMIETPVFLRDTSGVSAYLSAVRQRQSELDGKIRESVSERDFLRSKLQVITGMADSLFFKPKTVAKQ